MTNLTLTKTTQRHASSHSFYHKLCQLSLHPQTRSVDSAPLSGSFLMVAAVVEETWPLSRQTCWVLDSLLPGGQFFHSLSRSARSGTELQNMCPCCTCSTLLNPLAAHMGLGGELADRDVAAGPVVPPPASQAPELTGHSLPSCGHSLSKVSTTG